MGRRPTTICGLSHTNGQSTRSDLLFINHADPGRFDKRKIIDDANLRTQAAVDGQGWTMADALMLRDPVVASALRQP